MCSYSGLGVHTIPSVDDFTSKTINQQTQGQWDEMAIFCIRSAPCQTEQVSCSRGLKSAFSIRLVRVCFAIRKRIIQTE